MTQNEKNWNAQVHTVQASISKNDIMQALLSMGVTNAIDVIQEYAQQTDVIYKSVVNMLRDMVSND